MTGSDSEVCFAGKMERRKDKAEGVSVVCERE